MSEIGPGQPGIHDIARLQPFVDSLPAGEEKGTMLLIYNLVQLHKYVSEFAAAVGLLDLVDLQQRDLEASDLDPEARARCTHMLIRWVEMAGREAAMTVFHFGKTLTAVRRGYKGLTSIEVSADHAALRATFRRFTHEFPDADKTRHAVAHRGEATSTVSELASHSQDGVFVFGKMTARKYTITFGGSHRTLAVDGSVRRILAEIANATTAAFPPIAPDLPTSPT